MQDLKAKTIRGGFARLVAQMANFALRLVSLMILARLLGPKDFGLVGMVTAFTGILMLFRDFGLSAAAVQRPHVTEEQLSNLFWINLIVGAGLCLLTMGAAPAIAAFYREPRLVGVATVLGLAFLFNAAGIQHSAVLQREMRFTTMAVINTVGLVAGTVLAIGGAWAGYGYWALVAMTILVPLANTIGFWLASGWMPGRPTRGAGIRSMMQFGGTVTLNGLVVYIAANMEKVLIGRFWGVDAIGIYGRAFQLANIPTDNLNWAAGEVAFSALSRVQSQPEQLKRYFLKGYSIVVTLTVPITLACGLFADDVIRVFLGTKWMTAISIFRLLSPTILVFAVANPMSWLLSSLGWVKRQLYVSLAIAPTMLLAYLIALPHGPRGVALAYSTMMILWVVPIIAWSTHGSPIRFGDVMRALSRPVLATAVAGLLAFAFRSAWGHAFSPLPRLVLEIAILFVAFVTTLLLGSEQRSLYRDLLHSLLERTHAPAVSPASGSETL